MLKHSSFAHEGYHEFVGVYEFQKTDDNVFFKQIAGNGSDIGIGLIANKIANYDGITFSYDSDFAYDVAVHHTIISASHDTDVVHGLYSIDTGYGNFLPIEKTYTPSFLYLGDPSITEAQAKNLKTFAKSEWISRETFLNLYSNGVASGVWSISVCLLDPNQGDDAVYYYGSVMLSLPENYYNLGNICSSAGFCRSEANEYGIQVFMVMIEESSYVSVFGVPANNVTSNYTSLDYREIKFKKIG
jgi:hypothetical protein